MTNQEILRIAMEQSAADSGCSSYDFLKKENVIVASKANPKARRYLQLPFDCNLVSYGGNIVASVRPELMGVVKQYVNRYAVEHCFETPSLYALNDSLKQYGLAVCFMAEYFLPDTAHLQPLNCPYEIRSLCQDDFPPLYRPEWSNALCRERKDLDILGMGAYDNGRLVGLAGCSADCDSMWQIGIDVLPQYRKKGIASALTSRLALEILKRGKVPFYCAAWSNIKSVRNAIKSGFRPAWTDVTVKSNIFIGKMNSAERV